MGHPDMETSETFSELREVAWWMGVEEGLSVKEELTLERNDD